MIKKILVVPVLAFALVGCVQPGLLDSEICETYSGPTPPCTGNPQAPEATLNTNTFNVTPHCLLAARGTTMTFKVVPVGQNHVGSVLIFPKDLADTWLSGTNSPDKKEIKIFVPEHLDPGEIHQYGILLSNGECLDPRVRVM